MRRYSEVTSLYYLNPEVPTALNQYRPKSIPALYMSFSFKFRITNDQGPKTFRSPKISSVN